MKIAFWHFYTFRLLRGIETLILSLGNALARKGVEVTIVGASATTRPLIAPEPGVRVYGYPTARYFAHQTIVPFYAQHFLRHRYDHVVAFFADFGEAAAWRAVRPFVDLPLSLYFTYPYSQVPHRYHSFAKQGWGQTARHLLADADWVAREAAELFGRPVPVVPVGTDPRRFHPDPALRQALRARWGFGESEVVLLNVSALERGKGVWRAVEAMGRLRERYPQLRYFILGRGEDEANLRRQVGDLGLEGVVTFGGVTSELEAYYNMADVFVMLPDAEANSVACHEAMSSALPVVVSARGGFLESVPPEGGFHVDADRGDAVDAALSTLIDDPGRRETMGRHARQHVLENHTWDRVADRFLEVLK